jgi:Divergent InlB B-repeat domain
MTRSPNVSLCPLVILGVFVGLTSGLSAAVAATITLSWTDNSNNESGFSIQRKTGTSGTFAQIDTVGTNVRSYVDSGLAAATTYCYQVRAFNSAGNSAFTPEGCKTTPGGTPPASASTVFLEAENGNLTAPMAIQSASTASKGKFVEVPAGKGNNYNDATKGGPGEVRFTISIPQAGTRALWARTIASNNSDSFYVTRNGTLVKEWSVPPSTTWKWNKIANLSLAAGNINLAFRQREDGTKLDQVILTSDLGFIPGQAAPALATLAIGQSYDLSISVVKTLTKSGSGSGTVTTSPGGITCDSDCAAPYSAGTVLKLIATPAAGSVFAGWSGNTACDNGAVTMNTDIACTATFSPQTLGLNVIKSGNGNGAVVSSPSGITCGSDCSESYASGASVKLTATAASGSVFRGWSGGGCNKAITCTVVVNGSTSVTALFDTAESITAKIGVYRPSTGDFFLDRNGNGLWDGCQVDICLKWLAQKSGVPVAGNWDGADTTRIGTFDTTSGTWYLDRNGNNRWDGCEVDNCISSFGTPGDFSVVRSAIGSNRPGIGVFPSAVTGTIRRKDIITNWGLWKFDASGNSVSDGCQIDRCFWKHGNPGDFAVVGDWDGTGIGKIGVFDATRGTWLLDHNGNGLWDGCTVDKCLSNFGHMHDLPVAGDWDGTGKAMIGVFRPSTGEWFLDKNGNGQLDGCGVDTCISSFGNPGDLPVVGKW